MKLNKKALTIPFWIISFILVFTLSFNYIAPIFNQSIVLAVAMSMPEGVGKAIKNSMDKKFPKNVKLETENKIEEIKNDQKEEIENQTLPSSNITPLELNDNEKGGLIISETIKSGSGNSFIKIGETNGFIKNSTKLSVEEIKKELQTKSDIKIDLNSNEPQVLIFHTHGTESYDLYNQKNHKIGANSRSTDNEINMIKVGDEIVKQLVEAKIPYIHSKTLHDSPSYNGAYQRSKKETEYYLEKYPSIKVVIDIHRDAVYGDESTWKKLVCDINGKTAAQLMIITGCDDGSNLNTSWQNNLRFAAYLQGVTENDYPNLTRPVMFCYRNYNQQLSHGALLIEIGSHGNFLGEAVYTGELLGKSLAKALKQLSEN